MFHPPCTLNGNSETSSKIKCVTMKTLTKRQASALVAYIVRLEEKLDAFEIQYPNKSALAEDGMAKLIHFIGKLS